MNGIWKLLCLLAVVGLIVVSVILFGRINTLADQTAALTARAEGADQRLQRLYNLHRWVNLDFYPVYVQTHNKVWAGPGDPPALPPPPPTFD